MRVTDADGRGLSASGILEAFDNRVASKSPASPLASAIGDSFRNVSNSLSRWVDPIALEEQRKKEEREERRQERLQKARDAKEERAARAPAKSRAVFGVGGIGISGTGKGGGGVGYGYGRAAGRAERQDGKVMVMGRAAGGACGGRVPGRRRRRRRGGRGRAHPRGRAEGRLLRARGRSTRAAAPPCR